jgi:Recombinase
MRPRPRYAVIEIEARVVRQVYEQYTVAGLSIGAMTRELNDQGGATRKPNTRWERSMVWASATPRTAARRASGRPVWPRASVSRAPC